MNVSIIIATYGDPEWSDLAHERALPSAQAQDSHEILIGHDTDGTIASARNELAERADGDWLCFLDADDELAPGYLEAMRRAYEQAGGEDGTPRLLTPAVQKVRKGLSRPPAFYPQVDLMKANWLIIGTLLERSLFQRVGGFEDYPHGFEDWSLWFKCAHQGATVMKVPGAVYIQHINPRSKHRLGWKNRRWQVQTHQKVQAELEAWNP